MVINDRQVFVGILVDAVAEVIDLENDNIKDSPSLGSTVKNESISGVYHDGNKFITILEMNKIFAGDEIMDMNKITKEEEVIDRFLSGLIIKHNSLCLGRITEW